jgi:hypothetical protein
MKRCVPLKRQAQQQALFAPEGFPAALRSVPPRRLGGHLLRLPSLGLLPGAAFSAGAYASGKFLIAARIAGPAIMLCTLPEFASAQAIWEGAVNSNWNEPGNWSPTGVPAATETAIFNVAPPPSISTLGGVSVGALEFNTPGYTFDALDPVTINGAGVNANVAANAPMFNVIGQGFDSTPSIDFNGASSAGTARYVLGQVMDTNNGFNAGFEHGCPGDDHCR